MSPAHCQCNAQDGVYNKMVEKYIASFVDDRALNWKNLFTYIGLKLQYKLSFDYHYDSIEIAIWRKGMAPFFPKWIYAKNPLQWNHSGRTI